MGSYQKNYSMSSPYYLFELSTIRNIFTEGQFLALFLLLEVIIQNLQIL